MSNVKAVNPLRRAVHFLAPLPLILLAGAYFTGNLTINPIQAAAQWSGDIAIIFLLLTLACSPINTLFDIPMVLKLRRPLGLWTFYYATLHLLINVGLDYRFDFRLFRIDNMDKPYVLWGLLTITALMLLALTSRKWWKKTLGKGWKKLHKLVYLAGVTAVIHLALVVKGNLLELKGDLWKPLTAGVILVILLILRLPFVKSWISIQRQKRRTALAVKAKAVEADATELEPVVIQEEIKPR
ncbi:MAG: protein-methionine-sulfoxide reductase heme-binding subunit MsrQ [Bellilinea sp.]